MSEKKKYRTWTVPQTLEMLAGLRGDRSVAEVGREHQISENLFLHLAGWRAARSPVEGGALGRKIYELEILGNGLRTWE